MKMKQLTFLTTFVLSGSLVFSGCGDKGPSEADFKKEANAACKTYNTKAKELQTKLGTSASDPQKLAELFGEQETTFVTLISDLEKVDAPKKQKADFDKLVDQAKNSKELVARAKTAAQNKDTAAFQQVASENSKTRAEVKRLSSSLGLDECGKD